MFGHTVDPQNFYSILEIYDTLPDFDAGTTIRKGDLIQGSYGAAEPSQTSELVVLGAMFNTAMVTSVHKDDVNYQFPCTIPLASLEHDLTNGKAQNKGQIPDSLRSYIKQHNEDF